MEGFQASQKCSLCRTVHKDAHKRWDCSGCKQQICQAYVINGAQWQRPGQVIHVLQKRNPKKPRAPPVLSMCGVLTEVAIAAQASD